MSQYIQPQINMTNSNSNSTSTMSHNHNSTTTVTGCHNVNTRNVGNTWRLIHNNDDDSPNEAPLPQFMAKGCRKRTAHHDDSIHFVFDNQKSRDTDFEHDLDQMDCRPVHRSKKRKRKQHIDSYGDSDSGTTQRWYRNKRARSNSVMYTQMNESDGEGMEQDDKEMEQLQHDEEQPARTRRAAVPTIFLGNGNKSKSYRRRQYSLFKKIWHKMTKTEREEANYLMKELKALKARRLRV